MRTESQTGRAESQVRPRLLIRDESGRAATTEVPAVPAPTAARETVFDVRDVSVFYGTKRAVGWTTLKIYRHLITAVIGPSGCGKSTFLRSLNRMNDSIPGFKLEGQILYHGHDVYGGGVNRVEVRRRIGMVFQKPNPFPKSIYDNVAWAPRNLGMKSGLDERVERALRDAALWDEVKDRLQRQRARPLRRPAAAAVHRAGDRRRARRACCSTSPRSALDPIATASIEELMHSAQAPLHDRDRHAQHAAGRAGRRPDGVLHPRHRRARRHAGRVRRHRDDLQPSRATRGRATTSPGSSASRSWSRERGQGAKIDAAAATCCEQLRTALPAERRARAVRRSARRARAGGAGLVHAQDPLDLAELGIRVLEHRRTLDEHVDADLVADGHLVDEAAEVEL